MSKEMMVRLELGAASVVMMSEGVAYSPDVADDMMRRATEALKSSVQMAVEDGIPVIDDEVSKYFDDLCTCDDEDCECEGGDDCECDDAEEEMLTERQFIERLMKGLVDGD